MGSSKVHLGCNANSTISGASTISIGNNAGASNQGNDTIAIGTYAGVSSQGEDSIAIGFQAGQTNQSTSAIAIGYKAGFNRQGENSIAIGYNAGMEVQEKNTIAIGTNAAPDKQAEGGIAIGANAVSGLTLDGTQGTASIAIGNEAGFLGQNNYSIAIGYQAAYTTASISTIAIGNNAGGGNNGGLAEAESIAIGTFAGYKNLTENSIAIGTQAAYSTISGVNSNNMVVIGPYACSNSGNLLCGGVVVIGDHAGVKPLSFDIDRGKTSGGIAIGEYAAGLIRIPPPPPGPPLGTAVLESGAIAIGPYAAYCGAPEGSISIGRNANISSFGSNPAVTINTPFSIAIGDGAVGYGGVGGHPIAIGKDARSISDGIALGFDTNATTNGFYVNPIDGFSLPANIDGTTKVLKYDTTTKEITWNTLNTTPFPPVQGNVTILGLGTFPLNITSGPVGLYKTFVIDHPTKPDNYLVHACLEGPEAGVYYRGTAQICDSFAQGSNCFVEVELPEYVNTLATNFTVQVTPVFNGTLRMANATRVKDNKFRIYGDPGPVDWVVYGSRGNIEVEPLKKSTVVNGDGPYKWI